MASLSVAIVGSGFGGSILARILTRQGYDVVLLERATHPRFALGESSTPLAAICLERLATRYGLEDLRDLAAYGRWLRQMPEVRRGLKRGFTFYAHKPGLPYANDELNGARMLVAASPSDAVADAHWLREDVDALLVRQAVADGVEFLDRTEVTAVEAEGAGLRVTAVRDGKRRSVVADLVVDASGAGGLLARLFALPSHLRQMPVHTGLVFGHFTQVTPFAEAVSAEARLPRGPYPDERAAIHHMLAEGWMYALPFDDGVVSAGFVVEDRHTWSRLRALQPSQAWEQMLDRYPTLLRQFGAARVTRPVRTIDRLQRRSGRAAGANWLLLPHTFCFVSPLFSTGIAWTLLGVERVALVLESLGTSGERASHLRAGLDRYDAVLQAEADHLERLMGTAYRARRDFDVFCAHSHLYFAAASYAEAAQRLLPRSPTGDEWAWDGFIGSADPVLRGALADAEALLGNAEGHRVSGAEYLESVRRWIASRNIAGLADPDRHRLYPVDLDVLVAGAGLLGLTPDKLRAQLPRLRGGE